MCRALLLLALVGLPGLACGDAESPASTPEAANSQVPEVVHAPAGGVEAPPKDADAPEVIEEQEVTEPEVDPTARGFLEVRVFLDGEPVPNLPFDVHWLDEGNPSKTASRTEGNGVRKMPFDHGSQVLRVLVNPGPRTAPRTVVEQTFILGARTHVVSIDLAPGGIVGGVVLDIEGNPVPHADVVGFFETPEALDQQEHPSGRSLSRTNEQGRFRMGGFPAGPFTLEAGVEGQTAVWRPGGVIMEGQELRNLEILLEPSYIAYGQVSDMDDQSIAGAHVVAGKPGRRRTRRETDHEQVFHYPPRAIVTRSTAEGTFQIPGVPESQNWLVNVSHPNFKRAIKKLEAGQLDIWIEMRRGADLQGTVTDGDGTPLRQTQVWMLTDEGEPSAFTDQEGQYLFGALDPMEKVYMILYKPGYGMEFLGPMAVVEGMDPVDVVLSGGLPIQGIVKDAAGNPLSGVGLRIAGQVPEPGFPAMRMPEKFLDQYAVLSGPDGSFSFDGLYSGVFTVTATLPGKAKLAVEGVKPGETPLELQFGD